MAEPLIAPQSSRRLIRQALALARDDLERARLEDLDRRWEQRRLKVIVAGEAKRGKSTVVNALLGRPILPTGLIPLTSVITTVTNTDNRGAESLTVTFTDGRRMQPNLSELHRYVTETGNPSNHLGVREVEVRVTSPLLEDHAVELIDTPGIGSVFAHNTLEARNALAQLDAAVLVLSADPPITAAERDLLHAITETSLRTFVLVNKSDRFTVEEIYQSLAFTRQVCAQIAGRDLVPRACSAVRGESDPGFGQFTTELTQYLRNRGGGDLHLALQRHTLRALHAMLDARRIQRRALELAEQGDTTAAEELRRRLTAIAGQRAEISDRVNGSFARLRQRLDHAASAAVPELARDARSAFGQGWAHQVAKAPLTTLEQRARQVVADHLRSAVDAWRSAQATWLEGQLGAIVERSDADTEAQLALARQAVADTLDVPVRVDALRPTLAFSTRFRYDFSPAPSWDPPLRGTVAALRTGASRRRRIEKSVDAGIGLLTDRQIGRARADLQQRLDESRRELIIALDRGLAPTLEQIERALDTAAQGAQSAERDVLRREILGEEMALEELVAKVEDRQVSPSQERVGNE